MAAIRLVSNYRGVFCCLGFDWAIAVVLVEDGVGGCVLSSTFGACASNSAPGTTVAVNQIRCLRDPESLTKTRLALGTSRSLRDGVETVAGDGIITVVLTPWPKAQGADGLSGQGKLRQGHKPHYTTTDCFWSVAMGIVCRRNRSCCGRCNC